MNKKLGMMALTGALALVACSQGGQNNGGGQTTQHKLTVNFTGVASAPITITNSAGTVVDTESSVASGWSKSLPAGTYTVTPGAVTGYTTPGNQTANLNTADTALSFTYQATGGGTTPPAVAKAVNLVSIKDQDNNALPFQQEINDNKVATLFAAQTEESVCVLAKVTDANNAAVANSPVAISTTYTGTLDIQDGCTANITTASMRKLDANGATVMTDANGFARFRIFATYGTNNGGSGPFNNGDPAKLVLSAKDSAGNQLTPLEIKGFFLNMSHLYVQEGTVNGTGDNAVTFPLDPTTGKPLNSQGTTHRVGDTLNFTNVYGLRSNPGNIAPFNIFAYQKQPQTTPQYLPTSYTGSSSSLAYLAPGYVQYDLTGPDASKFQFVQSTDTNDTYSTDANFGNSGPFMPGGGTNTSAAGATSYRDYGRNNGVQIQPRAGVTLPANGQFNVQLKATYVFETTFGTNASGAPTVYDFPLKSVTINKTFNQGLLTISKYVDHHVLTWAGPQITLPATNAANANQYTTATYTIVVKNTGSQPVYNATVADQLPAELGVVTGSISNGGTYDPVKHAITWNYGSLANLTTVNPTDAPINLTFQVYARQKPGFKWTGGNVGNLPGTASPTNPAYTEQPLHPNTAPAGDTAALAAAAVPYADPYVVTDGSDYNDTTISYFPQQGSFTNQVTTDYNPVGDESTINVVRPLYRITKVLQTDRNPVQGAASVFNINFTQLNRTGISGNTTAELGGLSYADLFRLYPNEFSGAGTNPVVATDAAGNSVVNTTSAPRQNPYGINVKLSDVFQQPLDFTNATPITVTNPQGAALTPSAAVQTPAPGSMLANQTTGWTTIPVFQGRDAGSTQVTLTVDQDSTFSGALYNCAYLAADNLNQPALTTALYQNSSYALLVRGAKPWADGTSLGNTPGDDEVRATGGASTGGTSTDARADYPLPRALATDGTSANNGAGLAVFDPVQTGLQACDTVTTVAVAPNLAITTKGEYTDANPVLNDATKTDPVNSGATYYYKEDVTNSGGASNPTATLTYTLSDATASTFAGGARLYISTNGGQTFRDSGLTPTTQNGTTVVFSNVRVPAATPNGLGVVRVVLPTTAGTVAAGTNTTQTLTGTLDYPTQTPNPKTVTENTTIQGPAVTTVP